MESYERAEIERLVGSDEELARLWEEHLAYESRIEELARRRYLTSSESAERARLKKLKLAGKDRIAAILSQQAAR
jgi:uncharacterized protein YdcH (DUF465 family)